MNWSKIIYRAIIINGVFHIWWQAMELGAMPWWVALIAGIAFGFIIDYEEQIKIKGSDIYGSSDSRGEYNLTDEFLDQKRRTRTEI